MQKLNLNKVEVDNDTPDSLTNISVENTIQSSQQNKMKKWNNQINYKRFVKINKIIYN